MLLHSLRRLLIEVPHFEDTLSSWISSNGQLKFLVLSLSLVFIFSQQEGCQIGT